ncbi:uncharacterized protein Dvar_68790 [Desulfosarcina variabilis str. Montpellier]|uniref:hypothetical protein n=1 Tax=Desulfosarcina variabilis TaxID=2300 RepID=UPI003AFA34FA
MASAYRSGDGLRLGEIESIAFRLPFSLQPKRLSAYNRRHGQLHKKQYMNKLLPVVRAGHAREKK